MRLLFNGAVKYSNTKPQPLINGGTVICSDEMHQYLQSIHYSLQIREWIEHQKVSPVEHKTKLLINKIRSQLNIITTQQIRENNSNNDINDHQNYDTDKNNFNMNITPKVDVIDVNDANNVNMNMNKINMKMSHCMNLKNIKQGSIPIDVKYANQMNQYNDISTDIKNINMKKKKSVSLDTNNIRVLGVFENTFNLNQNPLQLTPNPMYIHSQQQTKEIKTQSNGIRMQQLHPMRVTMTENDIATYGIKVDDINHPQQTQFMLPHTDNHNQNFVNQQSLNQIIMNNVNNGIDLNAMNTNNGQMNQNMHGNMGSMTNMVNMSIMDINSLSNLDLPALSTSTNNNTSVTIKPSNLNLNNLSNLNGNIQSQSMQSQSMQTQMGYGCVHRSSYSVTGIVIIADNYHILYVWVGI